MSVRSLWVQQAIAECRVEVLKIPRTLNHAWALRSKGGEKVDSLRNYGPDNAQQNKNASPLTTHIAASDSRAVTCVSRVANKTGTRNLRGSTGEWDEDYVTDNMNQQKNNE